MQNDNSKFKIIKVIIVLSIAITATISIKTVLAQEPPKLNEKLGSCLRDKVGEEAFNSIKSGSRTPTSEEAAKGSSCFQQYGSINGQNKQIEKPKFSDSTTACLKKTLGENHEEQFASVSSEEEGRELSKKANVCFDQDSDNRKAGDSAKRCVIQTVGESEANKMFAGERPSKDSEIYKKLEQAGCLRKFERPRDGEKDANLSPEKKKCIESIMGELDREPTEEQKNQIGTQCFGGGPDGGGRPSLPSEVESCLREKMGDSFKTKPKKEMSDGEKNQAGECFRQHNFTPEGATQMGENRPQLSDSTRQCIERITGKSIDSGPMDESMKEQVGKECFGGGPGNVNGPGSQPPTAERPNGPNPDCEKGIIGSSQEITEEMRQRINQECYAGGTNIGPGNIPPEGTGEMRGSGGTGTLPGGCQDDACVQQYCAANPGACGPKPQ